MQLSVSEYLSILAVVVSVFAVVLNLENRGASAMLEDATSGRFVWRSVGPTPIRRFRYRTLEPVFHGQLWPGEWKTLDGVFATGQVFAGKYPLGAATTPPLVEVRYARSRFMPLPLKRQVFDAG